MPYFFIGDFIESHLVCYPPQKMTYNVGPGKNDSSVGGHITSMTMVYDTYNYLVGGFKHFLLSIICGIILPID